VDPSPDATREDDDVPEPMMTADVHSGSPVSPKSLLELQRQSVKHEAEIEALRKYAAPLLPAPARKLERTGFTLLLDHSLLGPNDTVQSWDKATLLSRLKEFIHSETKDTITSLTLGRFQKNKMRVSYSFTLL
jgi:hypothetical protein